MAKLKRSALLHYIDASFGGLTAAWSVIGKDVEDMSVELNPDTETVKNILDEQSVQDNGYTPSFSVDTYFADPTEAIYDKLKDISMNRLTGEDCKTKIMEVLVDKSEGPYDAWIEDCVVKPQSYGGAQGGVRIPYTVSFSGNRTQVTVTIDPTTKAVTIVTASNAVSGTESGNNSGSNSGNGGT